MNDEAARQGRPDTQPITCIHFSPERGGRGRREQTVSALELFPIVVEGGVTVSADAHATGTRTVRQRE